MSPPTLNHVAGILLGRSSIEMLAVDASRPITSVKSALVWTDAANQTANPNQLTIDLQSRITVFVRITRPENAAGWIGNRVGGNSLFQSGSWLWDPEWLNQTRMGPRLPVAQFLVLSSTIFSAIYFIFSTCEYYSTS